MNIKIAVFACTLAASLIPSLAMGETADLSKLSPEERTAFDKISASIDTWTGDGSTLRTIQADIDRLSLAEPDLVPLELEKYRLEWLRISDGIGAIKGSQSFLPVFLELQKKAPEYAKSYIIAARAYIFAHDYEGAKPSLKKASQLDAANPWVDLTWSLLYERELNRPGAVDFARDALQKARGNKIAIVAAIRAIAKNDGIPDSVSAAALATGLEHVEPEPDARVDIASSLIDGYYFEPGLMEAAAKIIGGATAKDNPSPRALLQWARMTLSTGFLYNKGSQQHYSADYLTSAKEILNSIVNEPDVRVDVLTQLSYVSISERDFEQAERHIEEMKEAGATAAKVARVNAQLLYSQGKHNEARDVYEKYDLNKNDTTYVAVGGGREFQNEWYLRRIEKDPTNPYNYGNYASFLLYTYKDPGNAIYHARKAMELRPYPNVQSTLSLALLAASGTTLRGGHLNEALETYQEARDVGFDEAFVKRYCYSFCPEVDAALTAFR